MTVIDVPANARVFLGVPVQPFSETLKTAIANELYALEGIEELHLPQCFAMGLMENPATVLVIIAGTTLSTERAAKKAKRALKKLLPSGESLDVWPMKFDSPYVQAVQQVGCRLERDPMSLPICRKPKLWSRLIGVC